MFTITSIKQLIKRGIHVELLCTSESRIHIEANNLGIIIHPIKAGGYFHPFSSLRMAFIIRGHGFDLIHTQFSRDLWVLVPSLQFLGKRIPLVLTKQVGSFIVKKDFLHQKLYRYVTKAFAISSVIKRNLIDTTPLSENQIELVPNGIDIKKYNPSEANGEKIRNDYHIGVDKLLIGMVARFTPGKGHEEFIKSAASLNTEYDNLHFIIVGEASRGEDQYADKIKSFAEKLNLKNLTFTGYRSDIPDVLNAMDIFVFPSHSEAFGIALIEAMAMEKPSVCSAADGVLDIAVDGKTAYLFEKQNASDLKEKLARLIENPDTRKTFAKEARKRVIENFDIAIITDKVCGIYEQLTKSSYHKSN